jgi:plastocyanin
MTRRPAAAGVLCCLTGIGIVIGCVSDRPGPAGPADTSGEPVTISDFSFQPPVVTVRVGDAVVWTNRDPAPHTVTADDGSFDSSVLSGGEVFRLIPDRRGDFPYFCTLHPFMRGTLRVTE